MEPPLLFPISKTLSDKVGKYSSKQNMNNYSGVSVTAIQAPEKWSSIISTPSMKTWIMWLKL